MSSSLKIAVVLALGVSASARADEIAVEGTLGSLDDGAVKAAVAHHAAEIRACYTDHSDRFIGGSVTILARVGIDGKVLGAHVIDGNLGAWPIEKCLVGLARKMDFGKPKGGIAEVRIPLDFTAANPAQPVEGYDDLARKLPELARCGKSGEVDLTLYVGIGGAVMQVGFAGDLADAWADCAAARVRGWKLTDPRGRVVKVQGAFRRTTP